VPSAGPRCPTTPDTAVNTERLSNICSFPRVEYWKAMNDFRLRFGKYKPKDRQSHDASAHYRIAISPAELNLLASTGARELSAGTASE
jgi:hypothetical protein